MKKFLLVTGITLLLFILGLSTSLFTSCEGPAGPAGEDASETCTQCHDDDTELLARQLQYQNSVHYLGGNFERDAPSCAPCHTHEGFIERMTTGEMTSISPENPTPPSCRTCHEIHESYDSTDWALRYTEPVELWITGTEVDLGMGNMCTNCHQPRVPDPLPAVGGGDVTISSPYWGIHHGPQSAIIAGTAGYEFSGDENYGTDPHLNVPDGCVTCHMAEPYGVQSGGHTMKMAYQYHGHLEFNTDGCTACHDDEEALVTTMENNRAEIENLLSQLEAKLVAQGVLTAEGSLNVPMTISSDLGGALLNYKLIEEDRSFGAHNPKYTLALLKNTIASI